MTFTSVLKRGLLTSSPILLAVLYGCSVAPAPTPYVAGAPHSAASRAVNSISFTLDGVPPTTRAGRDVRRLLVSFAGNRKPAELGSDGSTCSPCSATLNAPVKIEVFTVDAFDKHGKHLSRASIVPNLSEGPFVQLTLASTVASVSIFADDPRPDYGVKATTTLYVMGISDASFGSIVVGPGAFSQPIRLVNSLGGMRLSKTEIRSAADAPATIDYPGGLQSAYVTARSGGGSASLLVTPRLRVSSIALQGQPRPIIAAAGNYVWASLGSSVERLDIAHESKRVTKLPGTGDIANSLEGLADGTLWYASCIPFASAGIGTVAASGKPQFFPTTLESTFDCPNPAVGPDGNIWFSSSTSLAMMTPSGTFASVPVKPRPTIEKGLSDLVFARDGTIWMIAHYPSNPGSLVHLSQSGSILARYGHRKFSAVATDGRNRIYALGYKGIVAYDLSGKLQATFDPPRSVVSYIAANVNTVAPDGSVWFSLGGDAFEGYSLIARIAPDGAMSEFSVPSTDPVSGNDSIPSLAATADGSIWYPSASTASIYRVRF